jgi:tetratricopeptide (TPR) repeat protein
MSLPVDFGILAARQLLPGACSAIGLPLGAQAVDQVAAFLIERFTDQSRRLPAALGIAIQRAWKALEIALAGESFWNWLDRAEDRALRQQIRLFLDALPIDQLPAEQDEFRRLCLIDLRAARQKGRLDGVPPDLRDLARRTADLARFADPQRLLQAEWQIVEDMGQTLGRAGFQHLARLLALRTGPGQPLLAVAARYFFRRAVEGDRQLFQGLMWASWEDFAGAQQRGFAQLDEALAHHGQELDVRLGELHAFLGQIHAVVVDIRQEQARQGDRFQDLYQAVLDVQRRLDGLAQQPRPAPGLSIRNDEERQLLQQVLARYRGLPPGQQRQMPGLVQSVARSQVRLGDLAGARALVQTMETFLTDPMDLAEAHYHAFRAALARRDWPKALASFRQAAALDPARWTKERLRAEIGEVQAEFPGVVPEEIKRVLDEEMVRWGQPGS